MKMKRCEKEILDNKNLEAPDGDVLDKAKAAMPQKKNHRLNSRQLFAIVSSCVSILIVVVCIPFMMPAKNGVTIIKTNELDLEVIRSISEYNRIENQSILSFGSSYLTNKYTYESREVFIEEFSSINNTGVALLVEFKDNTANILFEKQEEYSAFSLNIQEFVMSDKKINWYEFEEKIYLNFTYESFTYYAILSGDISDWQNFLNEFLI